MKKFATLAMALLIMVLFAIQSASANEGFPQISIYEGAVQLSDYYMAEYCYLPECQWPHYSSDSASTYLDRVYTYNGLARELDPENWRKEVPVYDGEASLSTLSWKVWGKIDIVNVGESWIDQETGIQLRTHGGKHVVAKYEYEGYIYLSITSYQVNIIAGGEETEYWQAGKWDTSFDPRLLGNVMYVRVPVGIPNPTPTATVTPTPTPDPEPSNQVFLPVIVK